MLRAGKFPEESRDQRNRCVRRQVRPDPGQVQQQVERHPEPRAGNQSEEAHHDGLARVERVTHHAEVVGDLEQDADQRDPHQLPTVLGRDDGAEEPLAPADRAAREEQARADQDLPLAGSERRGLRQVSALPSGEVAGGPGAYRVRIVHRHSEDDSRMPAARTGGTGLAPAPSPPLRHRLFAGHPPARYGWLPSWRGDWAYRPGPPR